MKLFKVYFDEAIVIEGKSRFMGFVRANTTKEAIEIGERFGSVKSIFQEDDHPFLN